MVALVLALGRLADEFCFEPDIHFLRFGPIFAIKSSVPPFRWLSAASCNSQGPGEVFEERAGLAVCKLSSNAGTRWLQLLN
jgi:hypothetical protein